jgi:hypothetical protein
MNFKEYLGFNVIIIVWVFHFYRRSLLQSFQIYNQKTRLLNIPYNLNVSEPALSAVREARETRAQCLAQCDAVLSRYMTNYCKSFCPSSRKLEDTTAMETFERK